MLEKIIGGQLLSIDKEKIVIKKDNQVYVLDIIIKDDGDCCGYSKVKTLLIDKKEISKNPIITRVQVTENDYGWCDIATLTLFGLNKELAKIESESGSDSGWCYGACVTIECKALRIKKKLSAW